MKSLAILLSFLIFIVALIFAIHRKTFFPSGSIFTQFAEKSKYCKRCFSSFLLMTVVMGINIAFPFFKIQDKFSVFARQLMKITIILGISWFLLNLTFILESTILARYRIDEQDNLKARRIYTQVNMFTKVLHIIIAALTIVFLLMTFETFRRIGLALMTSAGIAGLILGLAAQKTLTAILSGLQLAITQPIRIDDVVVIENEWGKIEEITLTYVVIRIWDLRRLVVPTTYFLEKPFQNWTRVSADVLGAVLIHTDYALPIEEIRAELLKFLQTQAEWDGEIWGLQVTNSTGTNIELRALMGSKNASDAWNLRCKAREHLIRFIGERYPEFLPRTRISLKQDWKKNGKENQ